MRYDELRRSRRACWRCISGWERRRGRLRCVPCHSDAHVHNLMVDQQERVWLIDWDGASWSPIERT